MTCSRSLRRCGLGIILCLGLAGCIPGTDSPVDEQREPHYLRGQKLVGQMDYQGAIEEYQQAVEVNPRSASAHFELGWLYREKVNDPAAAIYHYDRFLKLNPHSDKADLVNQLITGCKLDLAKTVSSLGPPSQSAQLNLEKLLLENRDLKAQIAQWQAYYAGHNQPANTNPPPAQRAQVAPDPPRQISPAPDAPRADSPRFAGTTPAPPPGARPAVQPGARTYTIKSGDTMASVARRYGISLSSLQAANPQARPAHLQVGSILNIPAS